jgi:hypothetical protein
LALVWHQQWPLLFLDLLFLDLLFLDLQQFAVVAEAVVLNVEKVVAEVEVKRVKRVKSQGLHLLSYKSNSYIVTV